GERLRVRALGGRRRGGPNLPGAGPGPGPRLPRLRRVRGAVAGVADGPGAVGARTLHGPVDRRGGDRCDGRAADAGWGDPPGVGVAAGDGGAGGGLPAAGGGLSLDPPAERPPRSFVPPDGARGIRGP